MDKAQLLLLADAYKEQIFSKLHELVPGRMARLDRSVFEGKITEDAYLYARRCRKAFHEAAGGPAEDPHRFDSEGKGWLVSHCPNLYPLFGAAGRVMPHC